MNLKEFNHYECWNKNNTPNQFYALSVVAVVVVGVDDRSGIIFSTGVSIVSTEPVLNSIDYSEYRLPTPVTTCLNGTQKSTEKDACRPINFSRCSFCSVPTGVNKI